MTDNRSIEESDASFTPKFLECLTPRSAEACRRLGILPTEMAIRPFEFFAQPQLSSEIQKLRYQEYEAFRQETVEMVRGMRHDLVQSGWTKAPSLPQQAPRCRTASSGTRQLSSRKDDKQLFDKEQVEQRRIEKILKRQNKELENMMAYEVKIAKMVEKQEAKQEYRRQMEAKDRELKKLERQKLAEKQRAWQITKREEEEQERKKNEEIAKKMYQQNQRYVEEQKKVEEERKKEAILKQEERKRKKIELERRTRAILEEQHILAQRKAAQVRRREELRKQRMAQEKAILAEMHAAKTREARERVRNVLEDNDRQLDHKRAVFTQKLDQQKNRMISFQQEQEGTRHRKQFMREEAEVARLTALAEKRKKKEERDREILARERKAARLREQQKLAEMEQAEFKSELQRLSKCRKEANLQRIKRQENYRRAQIIEKVNLDAKRAKDLEKANEELMRERQANQIAMMRQKKELMTMFDHVKKQKDWSKLTTLPMATGSGGKTMAGSKSTGALTHNKTGGRPLSHSSSSRKF